MTATFERVKVDRITPHSRNVRRSLGDLEELAASIKAQGLLQPLVIAPVPIDAETQRQSTTLQPQRYVLIAGHRRLAAAQQAGVESVPCIVRDDLDTLAKQLESMLTENLQRTDLTVMEEADAYQQLELLGVKEAAIAKATGRGRKTVHERLLLASLPSKRREEYETGKLTLDGAVKCARLREKWADDTEILALIDRASTWSFSTAIDYDIQRILDDRNRPDEPEDDEETIDYAGQRAEREAEWERQRQERMARTAAIEAATDRMRDWLVDRVKVQAQTTIDGLMDWTLDEIVDNYAEDDWLPLLGIEPCGEDEDVDDAQLRIARELHALPHQDKVIAMVLAISGAATRRPYAFTRHAENMAALGYPLTDDDRALLEGQP